MSDKITFIYKGKKYEREYLCNNWSKFYIVYSKGSKYTFRQNVETYPETDGWFIEEEHQIPEDLVKIIGTALGKTFRKTAQNPRLARYGKMPIDNTPAPTIIYNIRLAVYDKTITVKNLLMMNYNGNPGNPMGYAEIFYEGNYIMGNLFFNPHTREFRALIPNFKINPHNNSVLSIGLMNAPIPGNQIPSIGEQMENPNPRDGVDFSYSDF
ncbi:hypothetical protein C3K47_15585 [Solitalea longa]|uniref:Uncharacterized protein n=1 Tax=Solitalea longa TaxID=2079460 RepID=A0A2S4ZYR8_9SPHI|nr:hypothetical protein [Solitalea longa]POY35480.1 hypothetical protein C3K47_15585 [Solitalea longa]